MSVSSTVFLRKGKAIFIELIDVGASQMIIDGKIKIKNGSAIERFTKDGIKFADGSELSADVVIFATGYVSALTELYSAQS
jgi:NADH dehydrogenase FAD-containing subunit